MAKSCQFGRPEYADIGGKYAEVTGKYAEIGGKAKDHFSEHACVA